MIKDRFFLLRILFFVFLIVFLISFFLILKWINDSLKIKTIQSNLLSHITINTIPDNDFELYNPVSKEDSLYWYYAKKEFYNFQFKDLMSENEDIVGWILLPGTNINYPVVQTSNNTFYLNHDLLKQKNNTGWVFMDYRNLNDSVNYNTIIYAHGRLDGTMFGTLKNVFSDEWLNNIDNHILYFSSLHYNSLWQIFSIYTLPAEDYYITTDFQNLEDYSVFLNVLKNRSNYDFQASIDSNDRILTLSTCLDNYGNRIVLHAKLIKKEKCLT